MSKKNKRSVKNLALNVSNSYAALQYIASHKRRTVVENTLLKGWSTITQNAFNASKELEDINSKALDKVTENQINLSNAVLEANTKFLKTCRKARSILIY